MLIKIANCYNDVYFMARCFIYNRFCLYGYRAWCCGHWESIYHIWPMCHFNTYTSGRTWHYELCRFNCDYAWQKNWPSKPNFIATSIKSNEYRRCHSSCQSIIFILFTVECIAAFILSFEWVPKYGIAKGIYYSFFHSISAFNNAGFSVWSDNLMSHSHSILVNLVISSLIILGGIGFTVIVDIKRKKNFKNLTLHSKLMLSSTLIINIIATVFIFIFEFHNSLSMRGFTHLKKAWLLISKLFQRVLPGLIQLIFPHYQSLPFY